MLYSYTLWSYYYNWKFFLLIFWEWHHKVIIYVFSLLRISYGIFLSALGDANSFKRLTFNAWWNNFYIILIIIRKRLVGKIWNFTFRCKRTLPIEWSKWNWEKGARKEFVYSVHVWYSCRVLYVLVYVCELLFCSIKSLKIVISETVSIEDSKF